MFSSLSALVFSKDKSIFKLVQIKWIGRRHIKWGLETIVFDGLKHVVRKEDMLLTSIFPGFTLCFQNAFKITGH